MLIICHASCVDECSPAISHSPAGMNVFLTKDLHAKLADFDFLIEIPEGVLVSGIFASPIPYAISLFI